MKLDFTAIRKETAESPPEAAVTACKMFRGIETHAGNNPAQNGSQTATEEQEKSERLTTLYRQEQAEHERNLEIYKEHQNNIRAAGSLRSEIAKGAKAGESPILLLLKACKCISLMTGDTVFYNQLEGDLESIYGIGLLEPDALQIELEKVQDRLRHLQQALERNTETADSKERIERAVKAHIEREKLLKAMIETGKAQL